MEGWRKVLEEGELEVVRNAGIVLLQREIPDYVNIQVAKEISRWSPTTIIMIDLKTHIIMVEASDFCGESFHPTYACPYHPRYGNHHSSSYASPQPHFCMSRPSPQSPQQERRTIEYIEKDIISDWLSPSTRKYPFDDWTEQDMNLTEQELDQWIEQRDQEAEEEIKSILQKISAETMSAIPLESVERTLALRENEADEAEKEIDVILERPEELQKESKDDQPLVLVKLPTLPCIFVRPYKGVVIKERLQIFYTADTFVSANHDLIDSYMLEVPDELLHLKEGMYDELPKVIDAPFVVDISKGEGITSFDDGFPNLFINNAQDIRGQHVAFLASFSSPSVIFEQLSIIFALPRLFVALFTLVLLFFPTGSFEGMEEEGDVATAFTMARILSNIPISRGGPTSLVIFDIHALQERFYFGDHVLPCFETGIPLLKRCLHQLPDAENISIAFRDDGAWKRFYKQLQHFSHAITMGFKKGFHWLKKVVFKTRGDLGNALAEAEEEVLEKRDGTPKDQLSSIKQTLKELQCKREERMKEFCDIQSQIIQVHEALHGSVVDKHIVDDKDLTTKRLRELKLVLQGLQSCKKCRCSVILDAGGMDGLTPVDPLTNVDIFSPNETELERLTGMPTESFEQISQSVAKIHEMVSFRTIIWTPQPVLLLRDGVGAITEEEQRSPSLLLCGVEALARKVAHLSDSIKLQSINWRSFDDGFPNLFINNAQDIRGQHVAFLASFSSPSVIFEQLSIIFALPRLFVASFTLVLPFFPTGSFEVQGYHNILPLEINIDLLVLPFSMKLVWMELLGERFYFGDHVLPCFETGIPLLKRRLHQLPDAENISIAFPDDGAWKRFYKQLQHFSHGDKWIVRLKEGNPAAHHVVIVDDLLEKRDGTPKDQLSSIKQTLKELQCKREERMREFCDIQSQIIQVHEALHGSVVDEHIVDDKDLTTKSLRELKLVLQGLQSEKCKKCGCSVILDLWGMDGLIRVDPLTNVDIFSPNETELERLTGMPTESFEQISQKHGVGAITEEEQRSPSLLLCGVEALARKVAHLSDPIKLQSINWRSFDDGFPNLFINNAQDIRGQHVAFLASFSSPSVIFEQLSIIFALPRLFVASFTLVLPFFPTGSFEGMEEEGDVATAFTMARILPNIPISRDGPTSLVIYDIHALQERFYFGDHVLPCFETGIPLLKRCLHQLPDAENISIAFLDDGAWKRFYKQLQHFSHGDKRIVRLKEGNLAAHHVVIVDDLLRKGSTEEEQRSPSLLLCGVEALARKVAHISDSIKLQSINWRSFDDGFPNLFINNAQDIRGQHVAFLASFSSPRVIFEQLSIIFAFPRLFVASFTLVLPFFPTGSFERMEEEGDVATAFTMAPILSNIPISRGGPTSLVIYDIHALQERFYFGDLVLPCGRGSISSYSIFPMLEKRDGTPKDQLSSIKQTLKELQCKREERMKEFCDIQSQIIQVHEALHGSVVDEHIVDDKDLTTKRLRELKMVLQGLQSEKAARSAGVPMILDAGGMDGLIPVDLLTNLEKRDGTPKDQLSSIKQTLKELQCKREERMKEFCDIQSQIIKVHEALHGSVVDEHIVDDKNLTTKRLRELKLVLQGLQSEQKRNPRFAPVYLNVYDLHPVNGSIHWLGLGLYHSGIQVHGVEYEFGGHDSPSTGIFRGKPRECPGLTLRKSILIGRTDLGPHEVHKFMEELSKSYTGTSYNLITKSATTSQRREPRLTGKRIPRWINRLAKIGEQLLL
ncbi:hypothetical protein Sjap_000714 [Stephania japonica]|uniref:PPPDE domain-containing protein n=1 Tax=Stephania japonica TaxID=461633 RepID=A0AAP0PST4_9MAGN